jgi:BRCA2 repeat
MFANDDEDDDEDGDMSKAKPAAAAVGEFVGFQTGRGKRVQPSAASLQRAHEWFTDDENNSEQQVGGGFKIGVNSPAVGEFVGFQTGRGQRVQPSAASLQRARALFTDDANNSNQQVGGFQIGVNSNNATKQDGGLGGFQTGRGKQVKPSVVSMQKIRTLFADEENNEQQAGEVGSVGFQTGRGAKVQVSVESMRKANVLLQDEDNNNSKQQSTSSGFGGFQTGRGKLVQPSKASLERAQALFADEDSSNSSNMQDVGALGGFVQVSEESMQKANHMFGDDDADIVSKDVVMLDDFNFNNNMEGFTGDFQTGRGKMVEVSEKSLQAARSVLSDEDQSPQLIPSTSPSGDGVDYGGNRDGENDRKRNFAGFGGFQTGNNKKVKVSADSIPSPLLLKTELTSLRHKKSRKFIGRRRRRRTQ